MLRTQISPLFRATASSRPWVGLMSTARSFSYEGETEVRGNGVGMMSDGIKRGITTGLGHSKQGLGPPITGLGPLQAEQGSAP